MAEEEKKSVRESPGVSPPPNIQPDSVSEDDDSDEVFAPRDDMNVLFLQKMQMVNWQIPLISTQTWRKL